MQRFPERQMPEGRIGLAVNRKNKPTGCPASPAYNRSSSMQCGQINNPSTLVNPSDICPHLLHIPELTSSARFMTTNSLISSLISVLDCNDVTNTYYSDHHTFLIDDRQSSHAFRIIR
jgi:hypothetical protein